MDSKLQRKIERIAKYNCANYVDKGCLLTGSLCVFSIVHGAPSCVWAQEALLPTNPLLESEYYASFKRKSLITKDQCISCGTSFIKRGNAHRFCSDCSAKKIRQSKRESARKKRA